MFLSGAKIVHRSANRIAGAVPDGDFAQSVEHTGPVLCRNVFVNKP